MAERYLGTPSHPHARLPFLFDTRFGGSDSKASAYNAGDPSSIPGSGSSSGEGTATHSSTLAWKISWMEEPGRVQSMGSQRVGHDWATSLSLFTSLLNEESRTDEGHSNAAPSGTSQEWFGHEQWEGVVMTWMPRLRRGSPFDWLITLERVRRSEKGMDDKVYWACWMEAKPKLHWPLLSPLEVAVVAKGVSTEQAFWCLGEGWKNGEGAELGARRPWSSNSSFPTISVCDSEQVQFCFLTWPFFLKNEGIFLNDAGVFPASILLGY